jgi:hypothetical protein
MKIRVPLFLTIFLLLPLASASLFGSEAEIGKAAPDFQLTDIEGKTHHLTAYHGKTVVLEWVNPECPFVVKHYRSGNMPKLQKSATENGVIWLSINSGRSGAQGDFTPNQVQSWATKTGANFSGYLKDGSGKVGRTYGAKTTPHMFVINPEGILVYDGAIDSIASSRDRDISRAENYVEQALAALQRGKMPEKAKSRPYGCSVKY